MRTTRLVTAIAATLALLMLPVAAQAGGRSKPHAHAQRSAGVVRSFRDGVLSIRLARGAIKTADVTDSTKLTCQTERSKRSRKRAKSRRKHARARRARAAVEAGEGDDPGADDGTGDDAGDDPGDDTGDGGDSGDDTGDDTTDDTGDGADEQDPVSKPHPAKHACSTASLRRGMRVKSAKLAPGTDGPVWTRIALLRKRR
jgi:hypothetical protein